MIASLKTHQKGFVGKQTLARLSSMPIDTMEERFRLLMELCTYADSLKIGIIADGKNPVPNLSTVRRVIIEANSMSHNITIVSFAFVTVMKELSFEIINATNNKGDFSKISEIYIGEIPDTEFLNPPLTTNMFNRVFSFIGKSGKVYGGVGVGAIHKYTTEDFTDIIEGMILEGRMIDFRTYLIENPDELKKEFGSYRNALMPFVKWHIDPEEKENKIMAYLNDHVSKPGTPDNGIVHDTVIIDEAANMEAMIGIDTAAPG